MSRINQINLIIYLIKLYLKAMFIKLTVNIQFINEKYYFNNHLLITYNFIIHKINLNKSYILSLFNHKSIILIDVN